MKRTITIDGTPCVVHGDPSPAALKIMRAPIHKVVRDRCKDNPNPRTEQKRKIIAYMQWWLEKNNIKTPSLYSKHCTIKYAGKRPYALWWPDEGITIPIPHWDFEPKVIQT